MPEDIKRYILYVLRIFFFFADAFHHFLQTDLMTDVFKT